MKAISLWQPHAQLMAVGVKKNETRSKAIRHRGDLAICSALKRIKPIDIPLDVMNWMRANCTQFGVKTINNMQDFLDLLPRGKVLCVVNVYDCKDAFELLGCISETETIFGAYHDQGYPCGRYGWLTNNLRTLKEPVPVIGRQFLFDLPPDVEAKVMAQL